MKRLPKVIACTALAVFALASCQNSASAPPKRSNAKLSALAVSVGTLAPAFAADTLDYAVTVPNATASITVTGTAADPNATLSANNGTAQTLSVGTNTVALVVTAQDGTTKKTYTVVVTRSEPPADLAVKGKWHMVGSGNDQDITFANDAITFNAGSNPGLGGDIVSYDNAAKSLVMKWKTHPAFAGKYQKWSWSGSPVNALSIGAEFATEAEAAADATTKYTGAITKIIFSDDFDRADTVSPDLSTAQWKVTYAPNAVSISGNRLRIGTANEQQATIETTDKLDLSSDFALSADFTNMRFGFYLLFGNSHILYFMPLEKGNYYILYPTSSAPAATATIAGSLTADTQYRLEVRKVGSVLASKITKGTSTVFTHNYTLSGTEDFSAVTFGMSGGGKSGFGTGDVYVDHVRIEKL